MKIDFRLDDKFCDKDELKSSWLDTKIPDDSVFFAGLFNVKKSKLLKKEFNMNKNQENGNSDDMKEASIFLKLKSHFRTIY